VTQQIKSLLVILAVIVLFFIIPYFWRQNRDKNIQQNSRYTCGKIVKKTGSLKNGNHWHYQFSVNGRIYEDYRSTHKDYAVKIGDYFLVNFSAENPQYSKVLYNYKLKKYDSVIVRQVWNEIPTELFVNAYKH
jgi:hypothetical protein